MGISKYIVIASVLVIISMGATISILYKKNAKANAQIELCNNNIDAYKNIITGEINKNNILVLDIDKLSGTNDSLLNKLNSTINKSKINPKKIESASIVSSEFRDTTYIPVNNINLVDLDTCIVKNKYTSIHVKYKDSTLVIVPDISDEFSFIYYIESKYRYKFFKRLFTFNWKRDYSLKYEFNNSNDLIRIKDIRVVSTKLK